MIIENRALTFVFYLLSQHLVFIEYQHIRGVLQLFQSNHWISEIYVLESVGVIEFTSIIYGLILIVKGIDLTKPKKVFLREWTYAGVGWISIKESLFSLSFIKFYLNFFSVYVDILQCDSYFYCYIKDEWS